jgi:hypothetical protein
LYVFFLDPLLLPPLEGMSLVVRQIASEKAILLGLEKAEEEKIKMVHEQFRVLKADCLEGIRRKENLAEQIRNRYFSFHIV